MDQKNVAILPDQLLEPSKRTLGDMANGERAVINCRDFLVLSDRSCWLRLDAELFLTKDFIHSVNLKRAEDGNFHVTVPSDMTYVPGSVRSSDIEGLAPVASVTVGPPARK
jgi:hypothetical protein